MAKKNKKRAAQRHQNPFSNHISRGSSGTVPPILVMTAVNLNSKRSSQIFAEMGKLPLPITHRPQLICSPGIPKSVMEASVEEIDAVIRQNIREHADEIKNLWAGFWPIPPNLHGEK